MTQPETTPHEIEGRWKWPDWGRRSYDALSSVMLGAPFEGHLELMLCLADEEGVKAELKIDNEEINHQSRLVLNPESASRLLPGHSYGRMFEVYLLADPNAVSKDHPSSHPKVEVLVNKKMIVAILHPLL